MAASSVDFFKPSFTHFSKAVRSTLTNFSFWMDAEYLSKFEKITLDSSLQFQEEFGGFHDATEYYSVEEEKENGVFYQYGVMLGKWGDLTKATAFEILNQVLFTNPGAPVKQALIRIQCNLFKLG